MLFVQVLLLPEGFYTLVADLCTLRKMIPESYKQERSPIFKIQTFLLREHLRERRNSTSLIINSLLQRRMSGRRVR